MKRFLSILLTLALCLGLCGAAFASGEPSAEPSGEPSGEIESETASFPDVYPEDAFVYYSDEELDVIIRAIINTMTYDEKLTAVSGDQAMTTPRGYGTGAWLGIPRLGVPIMRSYDGPMGVTSPSGLVTTKPVSEIGMAANFDVEAAYRNGVLYGRDNKASAGNLQLGIQLDNARDLFFGRTRDTYGEDWFLTGSIGAAQAAGMQSENVIAVLKHFSGYVDNSNPGSPSYVYVDEQTLHENITSGFEMAVKDGGALAIMSSYNKIDGPWYLNENVTETQAASNKYLQYTIARDIWGWKGMFITDWGGNQQYSLNRGTDMETPSAAKNSQASIEMSMEEGETTMEDVEIALYHILWALGKIGYLGLVELNDDGLTVKEEPGRTDPIELPDPPMGEEREAILEADYEIALEGTEGGAVLLKNDGALPLSAESGSIALIGESMANTFMGHYGESSYGSLTGTRSPYEGLYDILGDQVELYPAIDNFGVPVPAENLFVDAAGTKNGVTRTDVNTGEVYTDESISYLTNSKTYYNAEDGTAFPEGSEYVIETYLKVDESGVYTLLVGGIGGTTEASINMGIEEVGLAASTAVKFPTTMPVYTSTGVNFTVGSLYDPNGDASDEASGEASDEAATEASNEAASDEPVSDEPASDEAADAGEASADLEDDPTNGGEYGTFGGMATVTVTVSGCSKFNLEAGKTYKLTFHVTANSDLKDMQLCLNWKTPGYDDNIYADAIEAAKTHDTVVVSAYHRETNNNLALDSTAQNQLLLDVIVAAKEAGKRVIVVGYFALPVDVTDWIDDVDAFLCMWLPGQAAGQATAELLTGIVNPSGKLPVTWPKNAGDAQTDGLPQTGSEFTIEEGIYMGYRWYDKEGIEPRWDFGYGMSYTTFEYSDLKITEAADEGEEYGYDVTFTVTNTGDVAGSEAAQVYLGEIAVPENIMIAKYQLAGFVKIHDLQPGESETVTVHIDQRSLSYWDVNLETMYERDNGTVDKWTVATGTRTIYVGASSDDFRLSESVTIK